MKIKTFILTFLMMMSSPFLFGQHWTDPGNLGYENSMTVYAQVMLDNEVQTGDYQVAAFHGDELLEVGKIIPLQGTTSNYHVHLMIPGDNTTGNIYFKFFDGTKEYVSETEIPFEAFTSIGDHPNYSIIKFKAVAQIGDVVYPSLQKAINACKEGDNTIELLAENAEDVTIKQVEGVNVTIDGGTSRYDYSGTITIHGNARYQGAETLTFKNIDFTTDKAGHYFIDSNSTGSVERYAHNVTVLDCNFTATDAGVNSAVAMRIRQGFDIAINGGTFTNLHSALQAYGNAGITVSDITLTGKNGISAGTSTGVVIEGSDITATGYGVRADGTGAYEMTLTNNTISAELPVVVRKATGDYKLEVNGGSYTASNTEGYHVVFTKGDDGTYEAPTGDFQLTIAEGTDLNVFPVYVAKIGTKGYQTLAEAITAVGDGDVVIELLADVTFDYNARDAYGTTGTTSLTINGNGKTLTLNQKNSDWSSFGLANADAKVVFNNMIIEKTGYGDTSGAWNTHAIIFSSKVEMKDVTVNNSMAVQNGATLNNVTIKEANGYYGLWINGNGQSVTMNGGSITATNGGRGIKIADQYINAPASVTLNVTGTKFNTAKKAAVLVSSKAGAAIAASNVNIENVAEDNVNFAWVDEDWAAHYGKVTVTGGTLSQENLPVFAAALKNGDKVEGYYETLPKAVAAAQDGNTITMLQNDNVTATVKVNNNITLDLNGKTISCTETAAGSFALIEIQPAKELIVKDAANTGKITLTSTNNRGWSAYSSVISNQRGKLIVEGGIIEHLGGTDMAYGIDNLTNGKGTYAETVINGGTVKSTYRAIRQFLNGTEAQNILNVTGGTIEGTNKSIWMQDPSANANTGTLTVGENAQLKGDVYLYVTTGSTEWPVELSIAAAALQGGSTVLTSNLPAGVDVKNINGTYIKVSVVAAIGDNKYQTLDEAFAAAQNGDEVEILVAGTYALTTSGKNITITGAVDGVVFDNIGAKNMGGADVTFNNVTFNYATNSTYKGLQHSGNLTYSNCKINGQVFLYGESETFNNCIFSTTDSNNYNVWTYGAKEVAFNECTFNSAGKSVLIYTESATTFNTVTVTDCDFIASAPVEGKAAIEMDSSLSAGINLTIDGETTVNNFGSGNVSGNSLWNNKKGNETEANNDITVVVNNVTVLEPWAPVAKIGETPYETLAKAISAATAGQTITICSDVNENVTINKNLTIDGGDNNYTGTMTGNAGLNVTVQNLNFVNAWFDKSSKSTTGTYIFKNCSFNGYNATQNYAFRFKGANSVTIENCTVKYYKYSFLYVTSGTNAVTIKNVTVENCPSYGVYFASGVNSANIENLTVKNSNNGFVINNTANRTLNLKDCKFENVITAINHSDGTNTVTCNLSGENNNFGTSALSEYAKFVLTAADATLTAQENLTVNVTTELYNQGYVVEYNEGVYSVVAGNILNQTTDKKYAKLQAAIDAAENGDEIVVLKDITLGTGETREYTTTSGGTVSVRALNLISGKSVTIDLNGNTLYCEEEAEENQIYNFFAVTEEGHLTIKDSSEDGTGTVEIRNNDADATTVHSLIMCYNGTMTIENGNYKLHYGKNGNGMIYSQQSETVTVNGGNFWLGNVGTLENHSPWIFNASGRNGNRIIVNGGTFNDDVLHQYYAFEVESSEENALVNNNNGTWSVITNGAVAHVTERYVYPANYTTNYTNTVGYATLKDAIAAAHTYNYVTEEEMSTVTMLKNVTLDAYVTISKSVNLDLDQFNITREDGTALYFNGEGIEVTIDGEGTVSGTQAVYVDNGTVTINGGNYVGGYEAVYVINNGHAVINGGTFGAENDEDDTDFVLNEYDATRDVTTIAVYGGTFHGFNPENNAAEGAGTNFCAPGHGAVETAAGSNIWEVMPVQKQNLVKGWNWYSSYLNITTENLLGALGTNGKSIVQNTTWTADYMDGEWICDDHTFDVSKMYMIQTSEACELALTGNLVDASEITITLNPGWNWIGYPSNVEVRLEDALAGLQPSHGDEIKNQNDFAQYYDYEGTKMWLTYSFGNGNMKPTQGYMYYNASEDTKTFTYNIVPATTRGNNETEVATHYSVDYTKYPFNMTMVAVVDGAMDDNYEVAALVNGEVRGSARPVYVEVLDAYMLFLTISGDNVEEVSFKYYDLTTGEEYDLVNRIDYSNNAMVGSVNEPYVLSRGTTGIGDATMSQVNIYPNPTTTGTEINLEAVCDTVEVFNALGVKVAEYQNVDSIDALETAGIYVIRITNDGNVQNCRLVVK